MSERLGIKGEGEWKFSEECERRMDGQIGFDSDECAWVSETNESCRKGSIKSTRRHDLQPSRSVRLMSHTGEAWFRALDGTISGLLEILSDLNNFGALRFIITYMKHSQNSGGPFDCRLKPKTWIKFVPASCLSDWIIMNSFTVFRGCTRALSCNTLHWPRHTIPTKRLRFSSESLGRSLEMT